MQVNPRLISLSSTLKEILSVLFWPSHMIWLSDNEFTSRIIERGFEPVDSVISSTAASATLNLSSSEIVSEEMSSSSESSLWNKSYSVISVSFANSSSEK